jgi:hypothetical protein
MANKDVYALSGSAAETICNRQFVSEMLSAQTISGTIKGQIRCYESNVGVNATTAVHIRVCNEDGSIIRGTVLPISASDATTTPPEFSTTLTNRRFQDAGELFAIVLTGLAVQERDRLIIELGFREVGTTTTRYMRHSYGDNSGTDLPENNTTTTANNPWIEFNNTILHLPRAAVLEDRHVSDVVSNAPSIQLGVKIQEWQDIFD